MSKMSVIVPIYNAEEFIEQCVESILNQTLKDFECILIDDGSKDNSIAKAKQVTKEDNRFIYVAQANAGVSSARNTGLSLAKGEYICFIDSDDWVSENYLEELYADFIRNEDTDFVIQKFKKENSNNIFEDLYTYNQNLLKTSELNHSEIKIFDDGHPVSKLFKNEIIDKYKLRFDTKINIYEDLDFFLQYLSHCDLVYFSTKSNYYYRANSSSSTNANYFKNLEKSYPSLIKNLSELSKKLSLENNYHFKIEMSNLVVRYYYYLMIHNYGKFKKEFKNVTAEEKLFLEFNSTLDVKQKVIYFILRFSNKVLVQFIKRFS